MASDKLAIFVLSGFSSAGFTLKKAIRYTPWPPKQNTCTRVNDHGFRRLRRGRFDTGQASHTVSRSWASLTLFTTVNAMCPVLEDLQGPFTKYRK